MTAFYFILLLSLVGTYLALLHELKKRSRGLTPILGWMFGLAYFLIIPLTVVTIHGGYELPPSSGITEEWGQVNLHNPIFLRAYLFIWLALMLTCAVVYVSVMDLNILGETEWRVSRSRLEKVILVTMGLAVVDWIATIWMVGGISAFLISHWYTRNNDLAARFGDIFTLYMRLSLANQLLFTGAATLHMGQSLKERKVAGKFTLLIGLFLILEMIMSGNRIFIALFLMGFLGSCWLYGRKKLIVGLLLVSPLAIFGFTLWGLVRHDLSSLPESASFQVFESNLRTQTVSNFMSATEGASVMLLFHIIHDFGSKFEYLYGTTYARVFTFIIPRSIYPGRAIDFSAQAARCYVPGEETSLCATALGEAYANFGVFSLVALPVFSWMVVKFTRWLPRQGRNSALMTTVSFSVLIWFARCTFAENVMNLILISVFIWSLRLEKNLYLGKIAVPREGLISE